MASSSRSAVDDDLANVEFETSEDVDVIPTFDSMGLREDLLRGIYAYGEHEGGREARTRDGEGARGTWHWQVCRAGPQGSVLGRYFRDRFAISFLPW
jgi:hypothetical protein